ncbi:hypothetical protein L596_027915 [Steinernema carpocapsae]|uniref:Uncharacterized protein n=1 Tax=Steinernema carpocapsae TaxID=34508 RepID=A0A4U5LWZ5_STECR|nr:hypothetical protein L596_027915 [Steinernema carpocapsae]
MSSKWRPLPALASRLPRPAPLNPSTAIHRIIAAVSSFSITVFSSSTVTNVSSLPLPIVPFKDLSLRARARQSLARPSAVS